MELSVVLVLWFCVVMQKLSLTVFSERATRDDEAARMMLQNGPACHDFTTLRWKAVSVRSDRTRTRVRACMHIYIHTSTAAKGFDTWISSDHSTASGPHSRSAPTFFVSFPRHLKACALHRTSHPPPMCLFCCHD